MQSQNIVLYNCTFEIFMYIQERIQGGGNRGQSPPWALSEGRRKKLNFVHPAEYLGGDKYVFIVKSS